MYGDVRVDGLVVQRRPQPHDVVLIAARQQLEVREAHIEFVGDRREVVQVHFVVKGEEVSGEVDERSLQRSEPEQLFVCLFV